MKRKILSPSDYLRKILGPAVEYAARELGLDVVGNTKATISSSGLGSGIPLKLPHETTVTAGTKLHKQIQPYGNRNAAPVAGDSVAVHIDRNNNRWVAGKYVNNGDAVVDADYFLGMEVAAPGNNVLQSAPTEQSTNSATYAKLKEFYDARPGKFRVTFELARTGGTVQAIVRVLLPNGSYVDASAVATLTTTAYPTFTAKTLDTTIDSGLHGSTIAIFLLNTSGPAQTSYIQSAQLKYQRATASLSPYGAVLLD